MADETDANPIPETHSNDANATVKVKKTRAPRQPKTAAKSAPAATVAAPVKKARGPGKKNNTATGTAAKQSTSSAVKPTKAAVEPENAIRRGPRKSASVPAIDDGFAELLQLEEENQKLRKELSAKLRSENADLRKKLGRG